MSKFMAIGSVGVGSWDIKYRCGIGEASTVVPEIVARKVVLLRHAT